MLLGGEPGSSASLLTVPAEGEVQGTLVGLSRDGEPNLAAAGLFLDRAKPLFERSVLRRAAAALLVTFALVGLYRAVYLPDSLAQGPYCLVP